MEGKKGVLFWEIIRATRIIKPKYLVLENVDRLLKSPSKQRGRDFAIMLASFNNLDYSVEWRVINAAEYGRAQRRKRVFFFIYRNDTEYALKIDKQYDNNDYKSYLFTDGLFATKFPVACESVKNREVVHLLSNDIVNISDTFTGQFWNSGVMRNGVCVTIETKAQYKGAHLTLGDVVQDTHEIDNAYYLSDENKLAKFKYLRGAKKIERTTADGHKYIYAEGGMSPYDSLELPARTMLTSEGTVNRSTHLLHIDGKYRLLTPVEAERLQDFPDNWTSKKRLSNGDIVDVSDKMRMFFMGNALVTDIVKNIGEFIKEVEKGGAC